MEENRIKIVTMRVPQRISAKSCPGRGLNPWPPSLAQKPRQRCDSNAVRFFDRKLLIDLVDFQYQTIKELCASCIKIWRKSDQNCDRESAATRKCKMAAMTSSNSKFQKPRKMTLANILKIICVKFHQNRFIRLGCRDDTHTQTDAHTPWVRLQHIQSKWLNTKIGPEL